MSGFIVGVTLVVYLALLDRMERRNPSEAMWFAWLAAPAFAATIFALYLRDAA